MNKIRSVLVLAFILAITTPCFGSEASIKRKKNKWIAMVEQQIPEQQAVYPVA